MGRGPEVQSGEGERQFEKRWRGGGHHHKRRENMKQKTKRQDIKSKTSSGNKEGNGRRVKKQQAGHGDPESEREKEYKQGGEREQKGRGGGWREGTGRRGGEKSDVEGSGPGVRGLVHQM